LTGANDELDDDLAALLAFCHDGCRKNRREPEVVVVVVLLALAQGAYAGLDEGAVAAVFDSSIEVRSR